MGFLRTAAPTLCGVLYAWGVAWRFVHLFVLHRADLYIFSDMYMYVHRAVNLFNPAYVEGPEALIVPPGWHLMLGVLYHWDPSWNLAIGIQFVMSALVP
ncbi:MAG: hypothetical protein GTO03_06720, partial [Planctomycetales bacterium]|nr:hypothetical protein [Planctomycetales bacterium]